MPNAKKKQSRKTKILPHARCARDAEGKEGILARISRIPRIRVKKETARRLSTD
jgi:hypothetical protein